jgi:hypothetical protein
VCHFKAFRSTGRFFVCIGSAVFDRDFSPLVFRFAVAPGLVARFAGSEQVPTGVPL